MGCLFPVSTSGLSLDAKTLLVVPLRLAQGFSRCRDLSPPTLDVPLPRELAWVLSVVMCVCPVSVCVRDSGIMLHG